MSIRAPILHSFRRRILNVQRCRSPFRPLLSNRAVALNRTFLPTRSYAFISASELQFGQPLHETHPHLLEPGECTFSSFESSVVRTRGYAYVTVSSQYQIVDGL